MILLFLSLCITKAGSKHVGAVYSSDNKNPDERTQPLQNYWPFLQADDSDHNLTHTGGVFEDKKACSTPEMIPSNPHLNLAKLCPHVIETTLVILHIYSGFDRPGTMKDLANNFLLCHPHGHC